MKRTLDAETLKMAHLELTVIRNRLQTLGVKLSPSFRVRSRQMSAWESALRKVDAFRYSLEDIGGPLCGDSRIAKVAESINEDIDDMMAGARP